MAGKNNVFIILFVSLIGSLVLTGCKGKAAGDEKAAEEAVNKIFSAFAQQDADTLDEYLPATGIGSFVYNDPAGFEMYTSRMSWEITGCEKDEEIMYVTMKVTNVDMVSILKENPPKEGAQMPDPTQEQIDKARTKTFDYTIALVKSKDKYELYYEEENYEDMYKRVSGLINVITGGGYEYLASLIADR